MVATEYLRNQANACLRLARDCFDLATAARLRLMAADFRAKADEFEAADVGAAHGSSQTDHFRDNSAPSTLNARTLQSSSA
jgi:hypothetical protein